jgi:hypothetical protein
MRSFPKRVANLWTEFSAQNDDALATNVKEPQNPNKLVVAATFERANTYVFASRLIMNPKVAIVPASYGEKAQ